MIFIVFNILDDVIAIELFRKNYILNNMYVYSININDDELYLRWMALRYENYDKNYP